MSKILIVEDNQEQREWATLSLRGNNVVIAKTLLEFYSIIDKIDDFDFVITDLYLPANNNHNTKPKYINGLIIYDKLITALTNGDVRGVALLSNLEHHVHQIDNEVKVIMKLMSKCAGLHVPRKLDPLQVSDITKSSICSLNSLVLFDLNIRGYRHFMSPIDEVLTAEQVEKDFAGNGKVGCFNAVENNRYIHLKPFDVVVEALVANAK